MPYSECFKQTDNCPMGSFPDYRPRRLRRTAGLRRAFAETLVQPGDLVAPLFVKEGIAEPVPIGSMPGHYQHTIESLTKEARELAARNVSGVLLFGIPARKDPEANEAWARTGISQVALRAVKDELGDDFVVIADLCMCEYTDHGHCGIIKGGVVDNDATIEVYEKIAAAQAEAGADIVAPSGMMDGQVEAIREALDESHFDDTLILAYAAKYASSFYGPFRDAAEGAPRFGDRRGYQQDPANILEAMREVEADIAQGADAVMVKPAIGYLDVVREVRERFGYPVAAYNVSGEYAMLMAAVERGWLDERAATLEVLTSIRRAGADLVITYHAKKAAEWLA